MRLAVLVALLLSFTQLSWGQIYVPGDYPDVQTAINAASPGDTIIVQLPSTGPLVIDKPLSIVGDPSLKLYNGLADPGCPLGTWPNPVSLVGPGDGSVTLANVVAVNYPVPDCPFTPAPIVGTGFDELHIIGSNLQAPASGLTGSGYGAPAVSVDIPLVMVVDSTIVGGRDQIDQCGSSFPVPGYPGIENAAGTVVVLDAEVRGGDGGLTCISSFSCPAPAGSGSGLGPGGAGVSAHSLFAANSTIAGGVGSTLTLFPGGPGATVCGKDPDGLAAEVSQLVLLPGILQGASVMHVGSTWSLTYLATGPLANLFFSLAPSAPYSITGAGWAFLDPGTAINLGPVATGVQTLTFPIPPAPLLVGLRPAFQLLDGGQGLTRPVLSLILP